MSGVGQKVSHRRHVECRDCGEFEMEKQFHGREDTPGEEEYKGVELPDICPNCEADLAITIADGGTDPGVPVDATTPDGFDPDSVIERWEEIEEEGCAVSPDTDR